MWSKLGANGNTPDLGTRPQVGFRPVSPHMVDGKRIEPRVSDPKDAKQRPADVATPDPEDETPVHLSDSHGLTGASILGWCSEKAPSVSSSLPSRTQPADLRGKRAIHVRLIFFAISGTQIDVSPQASDDGRVLFGRGDIPANPHPGPRRQPRGVAQVPL